MSRSSSSCSRSAALAQARGTGQPPLLLPVQAHIKENPAWFHRFDVLWTPTEVRSLPCERPSSRGFGWPVRFKPCSSRRRRLEVRDGGGEVADRSGVHGRPTFVLLDRAGRVRWNQTAVRGLF
jgi:hypothetical protein